MAKVIRNSSKKKTESVWESLSWFCKHLLDFIVCIYMLLIIVVLPFYNQEGYTHIGTDKSVFFRQAARNCGMAALPVLACYLLFRLVLFFKEAHENLWTVIKNYLKKEVSLTDYFAFAYGAVVILSYIFSEYQEEALWGTIGWYMGAIPQLMLVASYFLISRAWTGRIWMILLAFPVSVAVFLLGLCNRFGYYPIDMQVVDASFISTIGNINWYCGYLVSVFFGGVFLLWKKDEQKLWQRVLLIIYAAIGYATLVTQGSSSGAVALAFVCLVLFCLSASDGKRMEAFWMEMCLLSISCLIMYILCSCQILKINTSAGIVKMFTATTVSIIMTLVSVLGYGIVSLCNHKEIYPKKVFTFLAKLICGGIVAAVAIYLLVVLFNTKSEGALLASTVLAENSMFTFSPKWGSSRGATWIAGVRCFWEQNLLHKLVGVGPDCMAAYIYNGASSEFLESVKASFGTARLTNAHNEWLTMLVHVGVLGAVAYVGIMISAICRYIKNRDYHVIAGACGFCLLAYTVNNVFSFQQSMSASTIFIVLAVGENYLRRSKRE